MHPVNNNTLSGTQHNTPSNHASILSKLAQTQGALIPNTSEKKLKITERIITDTTLEQEIVLSSKDFIQKLKDGEINEKTTSKFKVIGYLDFSGSEFLKTLPPNLEVNNGLRIYSCPNFTTLPKNLTAKTLQIEYCNQLTTLTENMSIQKGISVANCENLTKFSSENLTLNLESYFYVHGCPKLESLPDFTKIGGNLLIRTCPLLVNLPETANIAGNITIEHCPKITTMPVSWSTELVATNNNDPKVTLVNTGIPIEQIAQYNQTSTTNVGFILDVDTDKISPFSNLKEAFFYWNQFADNAVEIPTVIQKVQQLTTKQQQEDFCKLLYGLAMTRNSNSYKKKKKAERIMQIPHFLNTASESDKIVSFNYMTVSMPRNPEYNHAGILYGDILTRFTF